MHGMQAIEDKYSAVIATFVLTMDTFVPLFYWAVKQYEQNYILTGKFQTYNL